MQVINTAESGGFHKKTVFTSSGVFAPDKKTKTIFVEVVGAGGGGALRVGGAGSAPSGGAGGQCLSKWMSVLELQNRSVLIGAGGSSRAASSSVLFYGLDGGDSSFNGLIARGGTGGSSDFKLMPVQRIHGQPERIKSWSFGGSSWVFPLLMPGAGGVYGSLQDVFTTRGLESGINGLSVAAGGGAAARGSTSSTLYVVAGSGSGIAGAGGYGVSASAAAITAGDGEFPGGGGGAAYQLSTSGYMATSGRGANGCVTIWEFK